MASITVRSGQVGAGLCLPLARSRAVDIRCSSASGAANLARATGFSMMPPVTSWTEKGDVGRLVVSRVSIDVVSMNVIRSSAVLAGQEIRKAGVRARTGCAPFDLVSFPHGIRWANAGTGGALPRAVCDVRKHQRFSVTDGADFALCAVPAAATLGFVVDVLHIRNITQKTFLFLVMRLWPPKR